MNKDQNTNRIIKINFRWGLYIIVSLVIILILWIGLSSFLLADKGFFKQKIITSTSAVKQSKLSASSYHFELSDSTKKAKLITSKILSINGDFNSNNYTLQSNIGVYGVLNSFSILTSYTPLRDSLHGNYSSGLSLLLLEAIPNSFLKIFGPYTIDPLVNGLLQKVINTQYLNIFSEYKKFITNSMSSVIKSVFNFIGINIIKNDWVKSNSNKNPDGRTSFSNFQYTIESYTPSMWANFILDLLFNKNSHLGQNLFFKISGFIKQINNTLNKMSNFLKGNIDIKPLIKNFIYNLVYKSFDTLDNFLFTNDTFHHHALLSRKWYSRNYLIIRLFQSLPYVLNTAAKYIVNFIAPNNFWKSGQEYNSLFGFISHIIYDFKNIFYKNSHLGMLGWVLGNANWNWKSLYQTFNGTKNDYYNHYYSNYHQTILNNLDIVFTQTNNAIKQILN